MLSIDYITNSKDDAIIGLKKRGFKNVDVLDSIIELNNNRKKIQQELDNILFKSNTISNDASLWSSFSGTVKKNIKHLNETESIRGLRYFGPSKMSLFNLIIHSFSIIAVFRNQVLLRSILMVILLYYFYLGILSVFLQITIVLFNLLIFIVSFREDEKALLNCQDNLDNIKE